MENTEDDQEEDFKCGGCGEAIIRDGTFTMSITPPRKVPRKAEKLVKQGANTTWGLSKFHRYLLRRASTESRTRQNCRIKCSNCFKTAEFPIMKKLAVKKRQTKGFNTPGTSTPVDYASGSRSERKRKQKAPKDLNAGLIIPTSFTPSPYSQSQKTPARKATDREKEVQTRIVKGQTRRNMTFLSSAFKNQKEGESQSSLEKLLKD